MSYHGSDGIIKFEEENWNDLAEKFIEENRGAPRISWDEFILDAYEDYISSQEPPDLDDEYLHGRKVDD